MIKTQFIYKKTEYFYVKIILKFIIKNDNSVTFLYINQVLNVLILLIKAVFLKNSHVQNANNHNHFTHLKSIFNTKDKIFFIFFIMQFLYAITLSNHLYFYKQHLNVFQIYCKTAILMVSIFQITKIHIIFF